MVMKLACVAHDELDSSKAVKCLTRHMKEPRTGHMVELNGLGRCLFRNRTCVSRCPRQSSDASLHAYLESKWAGDLIGRHSTTGVLI